MTLPHALAAAWYFPITESTTSAFIGAAVTVVEYATAIKPSTESLPPLENIVFIALSFVIDRFSAVVTAYRPMTSFLETG